MKKLKGMTAAKKLTILAIVISLIFVGINVFWALFCGLPNYGYKARLGADGEDTAMGYSKEIDGLIYKANKAAYMSGRGYLHVFNNYIVDIGTNTDNGISIDYYIWPDAFGNYEYGVIIDDDIKGIDEMILFDENLNFLPANPDDTETNTRLEKLLNDNREEIKRRMDGAQNVWKLNENDTLYGLKAFVGSLFNSES